MKKLFNLILTLSIGLTTAVAIIAFTGPSANPPTGEGAFSAGTGAPANSLYVNSSGYVGVGTTDPGAKLGITGAIDSLLKLTRTGAANSTFFNLGTDNALVVNNSGVDTLTLKGGNVGIGTTNPGTNKLEVSGGPIKATGGLIIETRTSDPTSPVNGQIWLRTDL